MKQGMIGLGLLLAAMASSAADVYVQPTVRNDGTYVPGHYRTAPNSTPIDNYSTKGNVNPYTGKPGTIKPYQAPKPIQPIKIK